MGLKISQKKNGKEEVLFEFANATEQADGLMSKEDKKLLQTLSALLNATVQVSPANTREGDIVAEADYTVPAYTVGTGRLQVYLDGLLCVYGDGEDSVYSEVGEKGAVSTVIHFHQNIDNTCEILARAF